MKSDIREITETMNRDIDQTLTDINLIPPTYTGPLQSNLRKFISNEIAALFTEHTGFANMNELNTKLTQINSLERDLRIKKENFNQLELQYKKRCRKDRHSFPFYLH